MLYRMENESGVGPYHSDDYELFCMCCAHSDDPEEHPLPQTEGFEMQREHFCCFSSLYQLERWFSLSELRLLQRHGYRVYEIDGEVVANLRRQTIVRQGFRRVREIPLGELLGVTPFRRTP